MRESGHLFEKINLATLKDSKGFYDIYKCLYCGLTGKRRRINDVIEISSKLKHPYFCKKRPPCKKIKITFCTAHGKAFENCIPGSIRQRPHPNLTAIGGA